MKFDEREYQTKAIDGITEAFKKHSSTLLVMATGTGKCLAIGTPVLMFDGTIRRVEDIRVGDLIMGPDSQPREVLTTCSGFEDMFQITPKKGDSYTVNKSHILSLKITKGARRRGEWVVNIPLENYLASKPNFKHLAKGYRVPVEFSEKRVPLSPYFLGLWIGDGTSRAPQITTADPEIKEWLRGFAKLVGLRFVEMAQPKNKSSVCALSGKKTGRSKIKDNPVRAALKCLGLFCNKHVPMLYKANERAVRLLTLAGLMDSDGSLTFGGYDFISVSQIIANDVAFLARSLGLAAKISPCVKTCRNNGVSGNYFRVSISGDCSIIPCRVKRKQAPKRKQKKDVLVTGISVKPVGIGQYFGFTISGDGLFLLGDFTVTHNTEVFTRIIKQFQPLRSMVLAHRNELIIQARNKIQERLGLQVEIEKAELYASTGAFTKAPVIVSSIQTQISGPKDKRRYLRFDPNDFGLLICDESHHCPSASWKEVIAHYRKNPNLKLLGVTATPDRSDEEALGQIFESVAFEYSIHDAVEDGYLVDITQQFVSVKSLDFSHVRTTAGDLNEGDLSKIMETEENVQGVCQPAMEVMFALPPKTLSTIPVPQWKEYLSSLNRAPRRTIIFTVSVAQAEMCANIFTRAMEGVEWVCGKTKSESRASILSRFSKGETHAVVNCGVLTEGFDNPGVEVIIMARPTKSRSLYCQIIGRSTRTLPGVVDGIPTAESRREAIKQSAKPFCRILDFVGNSGRHKLVSCDDILGGKVSEEARELSKKKTLEEGKPVRVLVSLSKAQVDLEKKKAEEEERRRQEREARKRHLVAKADYGLKNVDPFGNGEKIPPEKRISRDGRAFSEKQAAILRKVGVDPNKIPYKQGQAIIGTYYSKPSEKMKATLQRAGFSSEEIEKLDFKAAIREIGKLRNNNWRRAA